MWTTRIVVGVLLQVEVEEFIEVVVGEVRVLTTAEGNILRHITRIEGHLR
jgi:hypothetical protein